MYSKTVRTRELTHDLTQFAISFSLYFTSWVLISNLHQSESWHRTYKINDANNCLFIKILFLFNYKLLTWSSCKVSSLKTGTFCGTEWMVLSSELLEHSLSEGNVGDSKSSSFLSVMFTATVSSSSESMIIIGSGSEMISITSSDSAPSCPVQKYIISST